MIKCWYMWPHMYILVRSVYGAVRSKQKPERNLQYLFVHMLVHNKHLLFNMDGTKKNT